MGVSRTTAQKWWRRWLAEGEPGIEEADPEAIVTSAPGGGAVTGAQILARLGDPNRFRTLAGVRSFSSLVPLLNASGVSGRRGPPTRRGDAALCEVGVTV